MAWDDDLDVNTSAYGIAAATSRYLRVVAGPGTGKSFALKRRVARLLEEGVDPERILPVTFTNVAAEDLQREMLLVGVPGCEDIRGSTLHALCMKILTRQNVFEAINRIPRPLNRFEMDPLLYDLGNQFGNKRDRAKRTRAYEAAWARLQHETPGFVANADDLAFEQALTRWLRFHQGMLIGEIIPHVYRYLRDNPGVPERNLYDHILVDEYQDLNKAEQRVVDLLSGNGHVCVVGDDDQSLYSFKFAHPAGIREFPDTHAPTVDHEILECRRCPTRVVAMANALIAHNQDREPRQLGIRAANGPGEVAIIQYQTLENEAVGIADLVVDLITNRGYEARDILVLAQRRSIGNPIHDALTGRGIPSKSYYQEGVLDNVDAQERMAVLKLFVDPQDRIALRWLLGFGANDFRSGAYARIRAHCEQTGESPWSVMTALESGEMQIRYTSQLVERFREIRQQIEALHDHDDVQGFIETWLGAIDDNDPFHQLVVEVGITAEEPSALMATLVEAISQPEIPPDVAEVRIMSLHKSKGLSSPVVIIAGCVEGVLPALDPQQSPVVQAASLEEQRRLLFVGITRVKADPNTNRPGILAITSSRSMSMADAMQSGIQPARFSYGRALVHTSRFVPELGPSAPEPIAG